MRDPCDLCRNNDAKWIALDERVHVYWEFYLTKALKPALRRREQQDGYFVCNECKRFKERTNARSKRPRRLRFLPWS